MPRLSDLGEIIGSALRRAGKILAAHRVELDVAADLPMLEVDAVLLEQALFNILDNAAKFAPEGSTIRIQGWRDGSFVGAAAFSTKATAFPPAISSAYSTSSTAPTRATRVRPGTGLGLAIARGFVEAMHGTVEAANRSDRRGAVFTIRLPVPAAARKLETAA